MDSCIIREEDGLPKNHTAAKRIDFLDYDSTSMSRIIQKYCVEKCEPLVISNLNKTTGWNEELFRLEYLKKHRGESKIVLKSQNDTNEDKLGNYIATIQEKYKLDSKDRVNSESRQLEIATLDSITTLVKNHEPWARDLGKFYGKDITCPTEYSEAIQSFLPEYLLPKGNCDLFSFLPERFQAENLMCYLGQDDTGTPMHRDLCGTMGHNIMTMASPGGYAEWIIVSNKDRDTLAACIKPSAVENRMYKRRNSNPVMKSSFMESDRAWLSQKVIEESTLNVKVIVQRPGDLIIIPSRAYHQVRNVGVSVKVAWNRITLRSLEYAFEDQIPLYQIINRPEVYKCKAIVHFSIKKWNEYLSSCKDWNEFRNLNVMKFKQDSFLQEAIALAELYYHKVLLPEVLDASNESGVVVDAPGEFCTIICDFCHSDVFYRYYHCKICDEYDLCMGCYSIGRSCQHVDRMLMYRSPVELSSLCGLYERFVTNVNRIYPFDNPIVNRSEQLSNPSMLETPNLATVCRTIEQFRKERGLKCNHLRCTHCARTTKMAFEKQEKVSILYAFQRYPCPNALEKFHDKNDVYVCEECSSECSFCKPITTISKIAIEYDLIYYAHPALDIRNWGAYFDLNMNRSCFYPKVFYDTFTESKGIEDPEEYMEVTNVKKTKNWKLKRKRKDEDDDYLP